MKCPRQDPQNLRLDDIYEVNCPKCDTVIEFWKGDKLAKCPKCNELVENPHAEET